ncbi:MAG: hypothetical protein JSV85_05305 [Candidatus Bathyarchaeota archaeon]|nr:MAG: hypothetical protein JSV85_05305 [Candidatus Bathyarchaeota archaeon]
MANMQGTDAFERISRRTHRWVISRILSAVLDKRAVSNVISATILTGAVIALSLAVFSWSESRTMDYNREFDDALDAETDRLEETLVYEYVFYSHSSRDVSVYLYNCGTIDDVKIGSVHIIKDSVLETFSTPTLCFFDGTEIPDQDLDAGEEGSFVLSLSTALPSSYYSVRVVTARGAVFYEGFVV